VVVFTKWRGRGRGRFLLTAVTGEASIARTTRFRVTAARTGLRRRERAPAAKICPTGSTPLLLTPLEVYCHALSRRPP